MAAQLFWDEHVRGEWLRGWDDAAGGEAAGIPPTAPPFDLERGVHIVELLKKAVVAEDAGESPAAADPSGGGGDNVPSSPAAAKYWGWLSNLHSMILVGAYATMDAVQDDLVGLALYGITRHGSEEGMVRLCRTLSIILPAVLRTCGVSPCQSVYFATGYSPPSRGMMGAGGGRGAAVLAAAPPTPAAISPAWMRDIDSRIARDPTGAFCTPATLSPEMTDRVLQVVYLDTLRARVLRCEYASYREYLLDVRHVYANAIAAGMASTTLGVADDGAAATVARAERELREINTLLGLREAPWESGGGAGGGMSADARDTCLRMLRDIEALDSQKRLAHPPPMAGVSGLGYFGDLQTLRAKLLRGLYATPAACAEDVVLMLAQHVAAMPPDAPEQQYYCELQVRIPAALAARGVVRG